MQKLQQNPSIATFRKSLNDYLIAAKHGTRFILRRHKTPLAEVGPVDAMPKDFVAKAAKVRFTLARDDFPSITNTMLRGRAIIVKKLVRGDDIPLAAIWPLPQYGIAGHFADRLRAVEDGQQELLERLLKFEPLLQLFSEINALQDEIDEKRRLSENLSATISRLREGRRDDLIS